MNKAGDTKVDKILKKIKNHPILSVIIIAGIIVIGIGSAIYAINIITSFIISVTKKTDLPFNLIDRDGIEIPESHLVYSVYSNSPIEFTDVTWIRDKGLLDIKVRNKSDDSLVITKLITSFKYDYNRGADLNPSGIHDFVPDKSKAINATKRQEPFNISKGYIVSYVIPPKGADRYLLTFNIRPEDLYEPKSTFGGEYVLEITLECNNKMTSTMISLPRLLSGKFNN